MKSKLLSAWHKLRCIFPKNVLVFAATVLLTLGFSFIVNLNLFVLGQTNEENPATQGQWSSIIDLPLIPAAAATLPDGKVLLWSASNRTDYTIGFNPQTWTSIFDPITKEATDTLIFSTKHEMFCPGTSHLADGRILIAGGSDDSATTIYNPFTDSWQSTQTMNIPRAYQSNVTLSDSRVFTIGGSWKETTIAKNGEVWQDDLGWLRLDNALVDPIIGKDPEGVYRGDNHAWLFAASNGRVFHAGPSPQMNWFTTSGLGSVTSTGNRGDDTYSMNGTAAMYDIGKILKAGGAEAYSLGYPANNRAYVIDINNDVTVRKVAPMQYARGFHNSVVLPNGQIIVIGGMPNPVTFSDQNAILVPELWNPISETWSSLASLLVPRTYHSVALLLADGRVFSGGGGLCGKCDVNHFDAQIYSPPYLFNSDGTLADQPTINTAPSTAVYGSTIEVTTNRAISNFSLIRFSSVTHSVNNDQRRIPVTFTTAGTNSYNLEIPANAGVAPPGYYMLFALDSQGVPSVANTIKVGSY
ncbi:galactose oxidase-like domain-containing protein [Iningainema tapete]|uniref:DUF1929 domain-containing protein n=1 Tax=Iningainema tapete BLCC-T55 TaxID=2748662 RepID=A0A8J7BZ55_9CYAN|nr:galactose oxidase-like domain-containing protein [Iningainema tapete]MBD2776912.1 DUF1929 domain-containing protein [Iningainema tapete BLCC-T55]